MALDCPHGKHKSLCNRLVRSPLGHMAQHLALTLAEVFARFQTWRLIGRRSSADDGQYLPDELPGDAFPGGLDEQVGESRPLVKDAQIACGLPGRKGALKRCPGPFFVAFRPACLSLQQGKFNHAVRQAMDRGQVELSFEIRERRMGIAGGSLDPGPGKPGQIVGLDRKSVV